MNALRDFFTPDAGQARTNWLNNVLQTYVADPVNYYLGPSGVPNKLQAVVNALEFTDAGDMPAAADAGRRLWNDPTIGNAAEYAAAGAAMMLPFYSARLGEGIADVAGDAARFWADESGALTLGKADPAIERAQDILDLLTSGRAADVTDEMLDLGDPVQNARLNMYLFDNYDLPMDEASRMARAGDMGFDVDVYRGDKRDILGLTRFDGRAEGGNGVLFSSDEARVANTYAPRVRNPSGETVIPLSIRSSGYREAGYTKPFPADGTEAEMENWMRGLDAFDQRIAQPGVKNAMFDREILNARAAEQPGAVFRQVVDDRIDTGRALPSDVYATLDPTSLRSRFARFDPRLAHLRNLSAGLAGTGILAPALMQDDQGEIDAFLSENGY